MGLVIILESTCIPWHLDKQRETRLGLRCSSGAGVVLGDGVLPFLVCSLGPLREAVDTDVAAFRVLWSACKERRRAGEETQRGHFGWQSNLVDAPGV